MSKPKWSTMIAKVAKESGVEESQVELVLRAFRYLTNYKNDWDLILMNKFHELPDEWEEKWKSK